MMRSSFVTAVGVYPTLLCLPLVFLVACGGGKATPPTTGGVDLAVSGQTVTKVRTAGKQVVLLEERLTSIFEDGPQRTLAILQSDGSTKSPYTPPSGWSVVDFVVHPSGDISAILTTATRCVLFGSIQMARFEATNYLSILLLPAIHSLTTPEASRLTTHFSLH